MVRGRLGVLGVLAEGASEVALVCALEIPKCPEPAALELWRILTRRSVIARGVGVSPRSLGQALETFFASTLSSCYNWVSEAILDYRI